MIKPKNQADLPVYLNNKRGFVLGLAVIFLLVLGVISMSFLQYMRQEKRRSVHLFHIEVGIEAANAAAELLFALVEGDFNDRTGQFYKDLEEHALKGKSFAPIKIKADSTKSADKVTYNGCFSVCPIVVKERFHDLVTWLADDGRGYFKIDITMRPQMEDRQFQHLPGFKKGLDRAGALITDILVDLDYDTDDNIPPSQVLIRMKRDMKAVNILPPFLSDFTLFVRNPANSESVNRLAVNRDGTRDINKNDSLFKPLTLKNHRPGHFGDGKRTTKSAKDPLESGRVFLGAGFHSPLILQLSAGNRDNMDIETKSDSYGESFHFMKQPGGNDERIISNSNDPVKKWSQNQLRSSFIFMGHNTKMEDMSVFQDDYSQVPVFPESRFGIYRGYSSGLQLWGNNQDISPCLVYGNIYRSWIRLGLISSENKLNLKMSYPGAVGTSLLRAVDIRKDGENPILNAAKFWMGLSFWLGMQNSTKAHPTYYYIPAWRDIEIAQRAQNQMEISNILQSSTFAVGGGNPDVETLLSAASAEPFFDICGYLGRDFRQASLLFAKSGGNYILIPNSPAMIPSPLPPNYECETVDNIYFIPNLDSCNETNFLENTNDLVKFVHSYANIASKIFNDPMDIEEEKRHLFGYNNGLSEIFAPSTQINDKAFMPWMDPGDRIKKAASHDTILDCLEGGKGDLVPGNFLASVEDRRLYFTGSSFSPDLDGERPVPKASIYITRQNIRNQKNIIKVLEQVEQDHNGWTTLRDYISITGPSMGKYKLGINGIVYIDNKEDIHLPGPLVVNGAGMLIFENDAVFYGDIIQSGPSSFLTIVSLNGSIRLRGKKAQASLCALAPSGMIRFEMGEQDGFEILGNMCVGKLDLGDFSGNNRNRMGGLIQYDFDRMKEGNKRAITAFTLAPYNQSFEVNPDD